MLQSEWYAERLKERRQRDRAFVATTRFQPGAVSEQDRKTKTDANRLKLVGRLAHAKSELERVSASEYLKELTGTLGADRLR